MGSPDGLDSGQEVTDFTTSSQAGAVKQDTWYRHTFCQQDFWLWCGLREEMLSFCQRQKGICVCGIRCLPSLVQPLVAGDGSLRQNTVQNLFFGRFSNIERSKWCVQHCAALTLNTIRDSLSWCKEAHVKPNDFYSKIKLKLNLITSTKNTKLT